MSISVSDSAVIDIALKVEPPDFSSIDPGSGTSTVMAYENRGGPLTWRKGEISGALRVDAKG
jgi:hypothetical protein